MQFTTLLFASLLALVVHATPGGRDRCRYTTKTVTKYAGRYGAPVVTVTAPGSCPARNTLTVTAPAVTATATLTLTVLPDAALQTTTVTETTTVTAAPTVGAGPGAGSCTPADNIVNPGFESSATSASPWTVANSGGATSGLVTQGSSGNVFRARLPSSGAAVVVSQSGVRVCGGGRYIFGARFSGGDGARASGCAAELLVGGQVVGGPYLAAGAGVYWDVLALYEPASTGDVVIGVRLRCTTNTVAMDLRIDDLTMSPR